MTDHPTPPNEGGPTPAAAILLVGLATLLFEILLTRIFSLTMWYHFAFVAISLGLFGIGAGGVAVTVAPTFFRPEIALRRMSQACLAFGLSIPVVFAIDLQLPFVPFGTVPDGDTIGLLLAYGLFTAKFLLLATPFFCSGLVLALAFTRNPEGVHTVYFADLVGGGLGCALAVPILLGLSGPSAVVLTGVFPLLAATLMYRARGEDRSAMGALGGVLLVLALVGVNEVSPVLEIERVKSYDAGKGQTVEAPLAFERWHPVSRVAVHTLEASGNPAGWFYSEPLPPFPRVMEVTNDGGARTYIYPALSQARREELFGADLSDIVYALTDAPKVLVVGVGGGKDVLSALTFGAAHVRAVEMNPVMIEAVQEVFGEFSGRPYDDPRVEIVIDEARNHVESHDDRYDAISISVTDTWAASSVGAYALTESYLYTAEAFDSFMGRLEDGGWLSITRWYPQETLRLVALVVEGLRAQGVEDPETRILMARNDWTSTLLVKNGPVTEAEDLAFRERAKSGGFPIVHTPSTGPQEGDVLGALHRLLLRSDDLVADAADLPISVEPPTDDRPFFFHFVRLRDALSGNIASEGSGFEVQHGRALALLMGLLQISIAVALLFVLGPVLWMRRKQRATAPLKARLTANLYFLALGFGFLLAEIPMMQNFILFLGNPIYSLSVVLFSMLIFSGLGSLLARKYLDGGRLKPVHAPLVALVVLVVFRFAVPVLFETAIGLPIAGRLVISVLAIAPIGLALGAPFPVGLSLLHRTKATPVPWAWAINGSASVAAPVIATTVAMLAGFSTAYLLGAACYAAAALLIGGFSESAPRATAEPVL